MSSKQDQDIAVVGMAVRFPQAPNLDAYWENLIAGRSSVQRFSKETAIADGVPREDAERDDYVLASALVDGVDIFDAGFFGFSRREAEMMDPQYRLFLETAYAALEAAGQTGRHRADSIGVFATSGMSLYSGKEMNTYYRVNVAHHAELLESVDAIQIKVLNDKDYLPTQLSYRLNLKGPSMAVQTACSSALVALQLAVQSLRRGECEVAVVGASAIHAPRHAGYRYSEGGIYSPEGVCRPFEKRAAGIVGGNGVGVVVLRRHEGALHDQDPIHAVIEGVAVNNDGADKVSYAAPSIEGQKANIRAALRDAGVSPAEIGMVEAHGTGTALGDPIEVAALSQVFAEVPMAPGSCAIGSVKSNVGHLDTAAGMASLIKAILAVQRGTIPPTAGFAAPNSLLNLERTPFYVSGEARAWPAGAGPRRALVCATGAGGTNAHVVLASYVQQDDASANGQSASSELDEEVRLLPLSAKDETSLRAQARQYAALLARAQAPLRDVCYTAATGREHFRWRLAATGSSRQQLVQALEAIADGAGAHAEVALGQVKGRSPRPVFVFTGQGAQYPGMGAELYDRYAAFREAIDRCEALYRIQRGASLKALMWQGEEAALARTEHTQPALFALEYALTQLWRSWGIEPAAVIGHSVGEFVAAHVAGVFTLEDAFSLLLLRAELMGSLPAGGAMLALQAPAAQLAALRETLPAGLEVAAFNSPEALVVAGPQEAIAALALRCDGDGDGILQRQLPVSHAFHSAAMEPVLERLTASAAGLRLHAPALPLASNVSGELAGTELAQAQYWGQQVRQPVRFEQGVHALVRAGHTLFLELGPRPVLSHFVRAAGSQLTALPSLAPGRALHTLVSTLGALHVRGADINWQAVFGHERPRRTALPTYPFNRQSYWLAAMPGMTASPRSAAQAPLIADSAASAAICHYVAWEALSASPPLPATAIARTSWMIVADRDCRVAPQLAQRMTAAGMTVGLLDTAAASSLAATGEPPDGIVHICAPAGARAGADTSAEALRRSSELLRTLHLARAAKTLHVVTLGGQAVGAADGAPHPASSALWGLARTARQELTAPSIHLADMPLEPCVASLNNLFADLAATTLPEEVAYRGAQRHQPTLQALSLAPAPAQPYKDGCMLVTGGLGGLAHLLVDHLIDKGASSIALLARRAPDDTEMRRISQWRAGGAQIHLLQADVANRQAVAAALSGLREQGAIVGGVFHLAGTLADRTLEALDASHLEQTLRPKAVGVETLCSLLEPAPRFAVLFSSLAATLGAPAQGSYATANAFLDGYAQALRRRGIHATSIAWGPWRDAGMASRLASAGNRGNVGNLPALASDAAFALLPGLVGGPEAQVVVADLSLLGRASAPTCNSLPVVARALWQGHTPPPASASRRPLPSLALPAQATQAERLDIMTERMRAHVASLLGEDEQAVDVEVPFERLGLDSLTILHLRNRLNTEFGTDLTAATFYKFSNCRTLAAHLMSTLPAAATTSAPASPPAPAPAAHPIADPGDASRSARAKLMATMLAELASLPGVLRAHTRAGTGNAGNADPSRGTGVHRNNI